MAALEAHEPDEPVGDLLDLLARQLPLAGAETDVLSHRHPREQRIVLEYHAAVAAGAGHRLALHCDLAGGRLLETGDDAQQGRLAAARGADQADELAVADRQVDAGKGVDVAIADLEALGDAADRDMGVLGLRHDAAGSTAIRDC